MGAICEHNPSDNPYLCNLIYGYCQFQTEDTVNGNCTICNALHGSGGGPVPPPLPYWGLTFTALQNNSTVGVQRVEGTSASYPCPDLSLRISYDGTEWTPYTVGTMINLGNGDSVCFSAGDGGNERTSASGRSGFGYNHFVGSGIISAKGSLDSILQNSGQITDTLPAYCYRYLFKDFTSLVASPSIVATGGSNSYTSLFYKCSNLESITYMPDSFSGTASWVMLIKEEGTFYCRSVLGTDATISRNVSSCPVGWNVVNID